MSRGRLVLMPSTLDFGVAVDADLHETLPLGALRTAAALSHWVVENAKTTRAFLKRVDAIVPLATPLQQLSIVELPRPPKGGRPTTFIDLTPLLQPTQQGHDVGLLSEAGMPAVADPGAALVQAAHAAGVQVVPWVGPSSLLLALAASGLEGQRFAFVGYLPVDANERSARIQALEALSRREKQTQLLIETPYRNEAVLAALAAQLKPDSWLSVSCGLTLPQGWTRTARVAAWRKAGTTLPNDIPAVFAFLAA